MPRGTKRRTTKQRRQTSRVEESGGRKRGVGARRTKQTSLASMTKGGSKKRGTGRKTARKASRMR